MDYNDEEKDLALRNIKCALNPDQSLLVAMNDEGRWMMAGNPTPVKTLPISAGLSRPHLAKIKPASMDIR